ncbi:MAG: WD40 repeat domain-containing protein [Gemmataceae bacterium]
MFWDDRQLAIFDFETGKESNPISLEKWPARWYTAAFFPDGKRIAVAPEGSRSLLVFEAASGQLRDEIPWHSPAVSEGVFSQDGQRIAAQGKGGGVRIWNLESNREERVLRGLSGSVTAASFSPDGNHILTANRDFFEGFRLWDCASGSPRTVREGVQQTPTYSFSPDSETSGCDALDRQKSDNHRCRIRQNRRTLECRPTSFACQHRLARAQSRLLVCSPQWSTKTLRA